jgi:hypothetical protein
VLGVGVAILVLNYQGEPLQRQSALYSSDLVQFFTGTRFDELPQDWVYNLWCTAGARCTNPQHVVTQPHQPIISVLAQLANEGQPELARSIALNVTKGLIQSQFNWEVNITTSAYGVLPETQLTLASRILPGPVEQRISSKTILYYTNSEHKLEGPYVGQITVWQ